MSKRAVPRFGKAHVPAVDSSLARADDAAVNLLCAAGRHRWVIRQEKGEAPYRQCARCQHYEHTSSWVAGYAHYRPPNGDEGGGGGPQGVTGY